MRTDFPRPWCSAQRSLLQLCVVLAVVVAPALQAAETDGVLYKCRGADEVISYQQEPCADSQKLAGKILFLPEEDVAPAAPALSTKPVRHVYECISLDDRVYVRRDGCGSHLQARSASSPNDPPLYVQDQGRRLANDEICGAARRGLERLKTQPDPTDERLREAQAIRDEFCRD